MQNLFPKFQKYTICIKNHGIHCIYIYLRADPLMLPRAYTAASLISVTSHLKCGTTSLYKATGEILDEHNL